MNADLEAIRDSWDKSTGEGRDEAGTRKACDDYVAAHSDEFTELSGMTLEQCVDAVTVFRNAGLEESQWRTEVWLLHKFEPQNIGGPATAVVRIVPEAVS